MEFKEDDGVIVTAPGLFPRIGVIRHIYTSQHPTGNYVMVSIVGSDGVEYGYYADELRVFP